MLQTILFLIDFVFFLLFAYFDDSMSGIGGYEPWKNWNTVDKNECTIVPKVVIYFLTVTELMRFSVEFCVVKFSGFW